MSFTSVTVTRPIVPSRYLSATFPPEPQPNSVVLDKEGIAWQRRDNGWTPSGGHFMADRLWLVLLAESGPVRLLWEAPAPATDTNGAAAEITAVEPPIGSVIIDSEGDTWTRLRDGRWLHDGLHYNWGDLLSEYGPVTVLHRESGMSPV